MAHINNAGIRKPLYTASVILEPGSGHHLGNLEFFIFFCQLPRNLPKDIENSSLIHPLCILADILLIIRKKLSLNRQRTLKAVLYDVLPDHRRHPAQNAVIQKQTAVNRPLRIVKGSQLPHMRKQLLRYGFPVPLGPQKFLKVKRAHGIIRLISHTVALDLSVVNSQHRATAYDIKSSILRKKL